MHAPKLIPLFAILAAALPLAGCGTTPDSRFYLLSARDAPRNDVAGPIVWVGPVLFPEYLARPEIVTRMTNHELHIADFERWGEPLEGSFARALVLDLAAELPSTRIVEQAWEVPGDPGQAVRRVTITVLRFDTDESGAAALDVRWTVGSLDGPEPPDIHHSSLKSDPVGEDVGARVGALSELVEELARRIAEGLRAG